MGVWGFRGLGVLGFWGFGVLGFTGLGFRVGCSDFVNWDVGGVGFGLQGAGSGGIAPLYPSP